MMKRKSK